MIEKATSMGQMAFEVTAGTVSAEAAVTQCLERIAALDGNIHAFTALRAEAALEEARLLDRSASRGPLHGVPFAVKDVFATADLPTEYNSPYYSGHRPARDAAVVESLRLAGAVLLGKLSTVEFAGMGAVPDTRNPYQLDHSPGGSSAGSGAAVGAGMVPLALATQTGGSTIRPAAYCGAAALKPTWGRVSVEGMKPLAPSIDTVGLIGSDVRMLSITAMALGLAEAVQSPIDRPIRVGLYRTPYFHEAEQPARDALALVQAQLRNAGHQVDEVPAISGTENLNQWQDVIMFAEGQSALRAEFARNPDIAHQEVRDLVSNAKGYQASDLVTAMDAVAKLRPVVDQAMSSYDVWLTPAVTGEAPLLKNGNGLASFNRLFTALHLPCLTLPVMLGPQGLPLGVQLIAPRYADQRLLRCAARLEAILRAG